ncbi:hypothetical protein PR048_019510 [Dryococelus australis]|uniref:Uncharacterized protein n=1 Tax=Dryococelus australis TaxID=614101 RepID=A0ABQ9H3S2_9NEOP|nr:hypothetical protein PR048_019510 [Dryococelus australis]
MLARICLIETFVRAGVARPAAFISVRRRHCVFVSSAGSFNWSVTHLAAVTTVDVNPGSGDLRILSNGVSHMGAVAVTTLCESLREVIPFVPSSSFQRFSITTSFHSVHSCVVPGPRYSAVGAGSELTSEMISHKLNWGERRVVGGRWKSLSATRVPQHESQTFCGATVAERLTRLPPTKANRAQFPAGSPVASGIRAGRCRWSAGFLGDLLFPPLLHSGAAPYSLQSPSSNHKTSLLRAALISSLTLDSSVPAWLFRQTAPEVVGLGQRLEFLAFCLTVTRPSLAESREACRADIVAIYNTSPEYQLALR